MVPIKLANQRTYPTLSAAFADLTIRYMHQSPEDWITAKKGHFDYTESAVITVDQPTSELDLGHVAWSQSRWTQFLRQYTDPEDMDDFLGRCIHAFPKTETGMVFKQRAKHDHSNCVYGISFHREPSAVIHLYSRASNLNPTGMLELSVAGILADIVRNRLQLQPRLVWFVGQLQFSSFWAYPWLYRFQSLWKDGLPEKSHQYTTYQRMDRGYKAFLEGERFKYARKNRVYQAMEKKYPSFVPHSLFTEGGDYWNTLSNVKK